MTSAYKAGPLTDSGIPPGFANHGPIRSILGRGEADRAFLFLAAASVGGVQRLLVLSEAAFSTSSNSVFLKSTWQTTAPYGGTLRHLTAFYGILRHFAYKYISIQSFRKMLFVHCNDSPLRSRLASEMSLNGPYI